MKSKQQTGLSAAKPLSPNQNWSDYDKGAPKTPWGPAQGAYNLAPGVRWFHTAGHGGLMVARGAAERFLSDAARKMANLWNGNYWFEEDSQYAIAFYENPDWSVKLTQIAGGSGGSKKEDFEDVVRESFPRYFELKESGFKMPDKLKVGDFLQFTKPVSFGTKSFQAGDVIQIAKLTSSSILFGAKPGEAVRFRMSQSFYNGGSVVKVQGPKVAASSSSQVTLDLSGNTLSVSFNEKTVGPFSRAQKEQASKALSSFPEEALLSDWNLGKGDFYSSEGKTWVRWYLSAVRGALSIKKKQNSSDTDALLQRFSPSVKATSAGLMLSAGVKYDPENPTHRQELASKMKEKLGAAGFKLSTDRSRDPGRHYGGGYKGKEEVWVFQHRKDPSLEVQVFTSITEGGDVRSKGADAIRVCLVVKNKAKLTDPNSPDAKQYDLGSECRVHRTGDIDDIVERTVERARDAYRRANEVERCNRCSAPLATSKAGKKFCSEVCWLPKKDPVNK